jgi:hypothetical protein
VTAVIEHPVGLIVSLSQKPFQPVQNSVLRRSLIEKDGNFSGLKTVVLKKSTDRIDIINTAFELMGRIRILVYTDK